MIHGLGIKNHVVGVAQVVPVIRLQQLEWDWVLLMAIGSEWIALKGLESYAVKYIQLVIRVLKTPKCLRHRHVRILLSWIT